jgi:hypothetical protein
MDTKNTIKEKVFTLNNAEYSKLYVERPGVVMFKPTEQAIRSGAWTSSGGFGVQYTASAVPGSRDFAYSRRSDGSADDHSVYRRDLCRRGALKLIKNPTNPHTVCACVDHKGQSCKMTALKLKDGSLKNYYVLQESFTEMLLFPVTEDSVGVFNEWKDSGNINNCANSEQRRANEQMFENLDPKEQRDVVTIVRNAYIEIGNQGRVVSGGQFETVGLEYTPEQQKIIDGMGTNQKDKQINK